MQNSNNRSLLLGTHSSAQEFKTSYIKAWKNPWEEIFKEGIPEDLLSPYPNFNYILNTIKENGCKKVLDVACGTGRHGIPLAQIGCEVYGFDISNRAVELAKNNFELHSLYANLIISDMFGHYPYPNNFFDAVIAIQAIYHGFPKDMESALFEIHRTLADNGYLFVTISRDEKRACKGGDHKSKKVDTNTFIPLSGREAGLVHFYANRKDIEILFSQLFSSYTLIDDIENSYYLVIARK